MKYCEPFPAGSLMRFVGSTALCTTSLRSRRVPLSGNELSFMASPGTKVLLSPQLEELVQAFQKAKADARRLLTGSAEEMLRKRPAQNSWSALECIGHLNLGNGMMLAEIGKVIAQAPN